MQRRLRGDVRPNRQREQRETGREITRDSKAIEIIFGEEVKSTNCQDRKIDSLSNTGKEARGTMRSAHMD